MDRMVSYPFVIGVVLCYFGYPAFRLSVLVFGLGGGACLGYVLGRGLFGTEMAAGIAAAAGALAGTLLLRFFVRTGLFLAGAGAGAAAGMALGLGLPEVLAASLVAACFTLFAARWILVMATSLAGAALSARELAGIEKAPLEEPGLFASFLFALFFLSGLAVQILLTRSKS